MWTRSTSEGKRGRHRPAKFLLPAFGACAAILAANLADGRPADAPEPERLERRLVEAIAKGDLDTYRRIVAEDYVVYDASGKEMSRADVIASYESGSRRYTNLEIFDVRSRVFGDTAIVSARTKGLRREGDRDVPNRVRYIRVYARRNGEWKAVAQMATPAAEDEKRAVSASLPPGNWGGDHAGLQVTEKGARLELDCAHGSIEGPIALDAQGSFDVPGTYVPEAPGPVRRDGDRASAVRYAGKLDGETLRLTVRGTVTDSDLGTFTLTRNRFPRVRKCD